MCKFYELRKEVLVLYDSVRTRQEEIPKEDIKLDSILEQFRVRLRQINNELCGMLARREVCTSYGT